MTVPSEAIVNLYDKEKSVDETNIWIRPRKRKEMGLTYIVICIDLLRFCLNRHSLLAQSPGCAVQRQCKTKSLRLRDPDCVNGGFCTGPIWSQLHWFLLST